MNNYELLIERIAKSAKLEKAEVERKVEAKKAKLSGLISKEGAAQIIAAELGINFEDQDLKVSELMTGMRKVNIIGKVVNIFPVREFEKNDRKGKVSNFILADETGSTRVVLWDINHIALIEDETIKVGDTVEIKNGSTRDSEIHLSGFSEIKKSSIKMDDVKEAPVATEVNLNEVRQGQNVKTRGIVVQVFQPRFYHVCPTCNKKVVAGEDEKYKCAEHGIVEKKDKAILNFVLDDGIESMRVVMFSDQIGQVVPEEDLKDEAKATAFRDDFLGTEIYLNGRVNRNQLFNNLEIVASGIERVDVEKLIEKLDKKD
jgi:ssDNA-binding replication factor A large subunit